MKESDIIWLLIRKASLGVLWSVDCKGQSANEEASQEVILAGQMRDDRNLDKLEQQR